MDKVKDTYKAHKISPERRKWTQKILRNLRLSKERRIKEGEVYAISYFPKDLPTDKWHAISLVYIVNVTPFEAEGYNLLYLPQDLLVNLLSQGYSVKKYKNSAFGLLVERELNSPPWVYTRKKYKSSQIQNFTQISREEWGMIPVIEKSLLGNLNPKLLEADWKEENTVHVINPVTKKKEPQIKPEGEEIIIEENASVREMVFGEKSLESRSEVPDLEDDI